MIKRILVALALVVLPSLAFAQSTDSDMLLTPGGTLYTIESVFAQDYPTVQTDATRFLVLSSQQGSTTTSSILPESLTPGTHVMPALAYDLDSDTLFVFWEKTPNNGMSSNLAFASYHAGQWSDATTIDLVDYHVRHNLRIGVTRKYDATGDDGKVGQYVGLTVHALWWDETGYGESAGYAAITIDKGSVTGLEVVPLSSLLKTQSDPFVVDSSFNREVLRHPALFESPAHDTIDVLYGDFALNGFHRLTLKPVLEGRLRVPVGLHDTTVGPPVHFRNTSDSSRISAIAADDRMVFYFNSQNAVNYLMYKDSVWSDLNSIATSDKLSSDAATEVIRRMLLAQ